MNGLKTASFSPVFSPTVPHLIETQRNEITFFDQCPLRYIFDLQKL